MGDRANIRLRFTGDKAIVIYSHWSGHDLHEMAQIGVAKVIESGRWGDEMYAARIFISNVVPSEGLLSWGIGFDEAPDAEHPLIEVFMVDGRVAIYDRLPFDQRNDPDSEAVYESTPRARFSAQEYVALDYDPRHRYSEIEAE